MGEGKIIILVKDGKVAVNRKFEQVNGGEMSLVMSTVDLLKQDLLSEYSKMVQSIQNDKK